MEDVFSWMDNKPAPPEAQVFPVGMRVLVVDDDQAYLNTLEMMLVGCSYRVTACNSTRGALELLEGRKEAFDIVITEVHMPDMDGFQFLEHVSCRFNLPVILLSYDGAMSNVMKGVKLGACEYILKPLRMVEMRNIWQHLNRKWINEVKEIESYGDIFAGFFSSEECSSSQCKKRKQMDEKQDIDPTIPLKRVRIVWTRDLDDKFLHAVNKIGVKKATPKRIQELMNVPWLTCGQIASHLQKYRLTNEHDIANNIRELHHPCKALQQQPSPSTLTEEAAAFKDILLYGSHISHADYQSSTLLDISEGEFLYCPASLPISTSTVTTEDQNFTSSGSITAGASHENFYLSDNSHYTHPDEVMQEGCSRSLADLDTESWGYDQWSPICAMPCR